MNNYLIFEKNFITVTNVLFVSIINKFEQIAKHSEWPVGVSKLSYSFFKGYLNFMLKPNESGLKLHCVIILLSCQCAWTK